MKNIFFSSLLFSLLFCFPISSNAQIDSLSEGSKIRITSQQYFYKPIIGTFRNIELNAISILFSNKEVTIPLQKIQKIEISKGLKRETYTGAAIGSIFGGLILGFILYLEEQDADGFARIGHPGFGGGFISGALVGGGIGAVIGYNIKSNNWHEIKISKQFNL